MNFLKGAAILLIAGACIPRLSSFCGGALALPDVDLRAGGTAKAVASGRIMSGALRWEACVNNGQGGWFVWWTNCPSAIIVQHSEDLRTWVDVLSISQIGGNGLNGIGDFEWPLRVEDEAVFYRLRIP